MGKIFRESEDIKTMDFKFEGAAIHQSACVINAEGIARLRGLRLFHWRKMMFHRENENEHINPERNKLLADMHTGFVQTLNDFFPVGDTAEKDAMK